MPSPDDYRRAAGYRRNGAADTVTKAVPLVAAAPESETAAPNIGDMVTRNGDATWLSPVWLDAVQQNPDLILQKDGGESLKLYDALLDDDTAMSTLQQRRLAIVSREWQVDPGDETDPRSVLAADDLRAMLKAVGWDRVTGLMHYGVWYGYGVAEAMYGTKLHEGRNIIWLDDIVVPDRRWFGFTGAGELRQTSGFSGLSGEVLPPNKFWVLRTGGTHDFAFYGLGLAHWVYWPVFFKRAAIKFWALYLEKFGMPTVGIEFPIEEANDKAKIAQRLQAAVAVGKDSAVAVPWDTLKNDRLKLIEASRTGSGSASYDEFVKVNDEAIMRVVLGQPGTSKGVSSGLNSNQATEHAEVKDEIVKADSDLICESFNRTIAVWLTRWNHGEDVKPPRVYRVLDDAEDLNTVAERDVKLDGIGIKRTDKSVAEVYGDGYEIDRLSEEDKAKQAQALAASKSVQPVANDNRAPAKTRAATFAAQFDIEGKAPLYVRRDVLNVADIRAWVAKQKIPGIVPDLHVTQLYSKTAVDWFDMGEPWMQDSEGRLKLIAGGPRTVERFGHGGNDSPVVLRVASRDLTYRFEEMIERGASSDYPDYKPHVTISYDVPEGFDLSEIEPYDGEIILGPEIFEPIREKEPEFGALEFGAAEEEAIDRLVSALVNDTNPVFSAMAEKLRENMQGVTTLEGARVALLTAFEEMPIDRLARLTALPMLGQRVASMVGQENAIEV